MLICKSLLTCVCIEIKITNDLRNSNNKTDTTMSYLNIIFHHIHSHHHYFQFLFAK